MRAPGRILTLEPIVQLLTVIFDESREKAPIETSGPMTQQLPMDTPSCICGFLSFLLNISGYLYIFTLPQHFQEEQDNQIESSFREHANNFHRST